MATYNTKYYGFYDLADGGKVRLLIQERDWNGGSYRIAHMQGLSLEIGGGSDPIYTPVVKTSLRFSMADAYDIGATVGGIECIEDGAKHGRWEELYTNDATKYRVILRWEPASGASAAPSRDAAIWTGYLTPDSWQEDMYYHGSIAFTARDMLGALSDVDFDAPGTDGVITVAELINGAVAKCQAAMAVSLQTDRALVNIAANESIFASRIPVAAFDGATWWDALTDTLEALGLVMRYNGNNGWAVAALRYLPTLLSREQHTCGFINHTGVRQLDPPVKDISSEFNLDITEADVPAPAVADYSSFGNVKVLTKHKELINPVAQSNAPGFGLSQASGGWAALAGSAECPPLFTKPLAAFGGAFDVSPSPYFICNTGQKNLIGTQLNYGRAVTRASVFTAPCRLIIAQDGPLVTIFGSYFNLVRVLGDHAMPALESARVYISDGNGNYYDGNGSWSQGTEKTSDKDDTAGALDPILIPFSAGVAELDIIPPSGTTKMDITVNIVHVAVAGDISSVVNDAMFAPLAVSIAEPSVSKLPNIYSVRTEYNDAYNVRITRTPALGSVDTVLPKALFTNVLLGASAPLSNSWNWPGSVTGYPLEVMVQAQLLMLYAASMSVFTGTFYDKTYPWAIPGSSYLYFARPCVLMRGTYDFTTGYVRDVALREYLTWDQVWGTFAPEYTVVAERGTGAGAGSGASGRGTAGGGGTLVSWGEETAGHYAPLSVGSDTRNVALPGHGHTIAEVDNLQTTLDTQAAAILAVKTAFEDLFTKVNAGTEANPSYRIRANYDLYSVGDVAALGPGSGSGGGGGSNVAWDQIQGATGGVRIATITINDVDTAVYAPAAPVSSVAGLTGVITSSALRTAMGLGTAAQKNVGVANGVASLDANGRVPSAQLPSYVDDVLEYSSRSAFPATGESGKIYVALDTNLTYRWGGSGSGYVEISPSLALGETSSTAYRGDRGKYAYDFAVASGFGTPGDDYVPVTLGSSTENVLTAHQSLANCAKLNADNTFTGVNTFSARITANAGILIPVTSGIDVKSGSTVKRMLSFNWWNNGANGHIIPPSDVSYNLGDSSAPFYYLFTKQIALGAYGGNIWGDSSNDDPILSVWGTSSAPYGDLVFGHDSASAKRNMLFASKASTTFKVAGVEKYRMDASCLRPASNGGLDLGAGSYRWNKVYALRWHPTSSDNIYVEYNTTIGAFYFHGNIAASGDICALHPGSGSGNPWQVSSSILPTQNNAYALGSSALRFSDAYVVNANASGTITADTINVTNLNVADTLIWFASDPDLLDDDGASVLNGEDIDVSAADFAEIVAGRKRRIRTGNATTGYTYHTVLAISGTTDEYIVHFGAGYRLEQVGDGYYRIYSS